MSGTGGVASGSCSCKHCSRRPASRGCSRIEWTTDSGNASAQAFYQALGLPQHPSKVFYRVEGTGRGFQIPGGTVA